MAATWVPLLAYSLCTLVLKALASPFESNLPQRHLLANDDELTTTDIIIISVTCSAFGIAGIVGGVYVFFNRKKIFSSVSPTKTRNIKADVAEMHTFSDPGPSIPSNPSPPPEGAAGLPAVEEPPRYYDFTKQDPDDTDDSVSERF